MICSFCKQPMVAWYDQQFKVTYHHCPTCGFIQLDPADRVEAADEFAQYELHENSIEDEGYVDFLNRAIDGGIGKFMDGGRLLDFGSGPEPVLAELLRRRGYEVTLYDLFYHDVPSAFEKTYAGIVTTEVVEHLADPPAVFKRLAACLDKGGYLSLMTLFAPEERDVFLDWHYRRDPTHIAFYTPETFRYFESLYGLRLIDHDGKRVATFRRV